MILSDDEGAGHELEADDLKRRVVVERHEHQRFCSLDPEHIALALRVHPAARHEEEIGEPVDEGEHAVAHPLIRVGGELDDEALGAPAHGAAR